MMLNQTLCRDERCHSECKTYATPLSQCYSPASLFPGDAQWGLADVLDFANDTHLNRSFFTTTNGTCGELTDYYELPFEACIGPFGKPRPWGTFSRETADDEATCRAHVQKHATDVQRQATGVLAHPYLVPSGPYEQLWDWDAVFLGVATLRWGNTPFLAGSMKNFFDATNLSTGHCTGCLTPTLPTVCSSSKAEHDALVHAKPILIQGAWLVASSPDGDGPAAWEPYSTAMDALLQFWARPPRRDPNTGLRTWHDQMESGADNGVLSRCPSERSDCWTEQQAYTLASADVITLLQRELTAAAMFRDAWAAAHGGTNGTGSTRGTPSLGYHHQRRILHEEAARRYRKEAESLQAALNTHLWRSDLGFHVAMNLTTQAPILAQTYAMAYPLWARLVNQSQAASIARVLASSDMLSAVGLRSASSADPRYSNADTIVPYSNWRGPMWVNVNAIACYGLAAYRFKDLALEIATRVTATLANDLRASGTWHEAYNTDTRASIGGSGFMSWDALSASLVSNLHAGIDPFHLHPG